MSTLGLQVLFGLPPLELVLELLRQKALLPHEMLSFYISCLVGKYVASLSDYSLKFTFATVLLRLLLMIIVLLLALGKPFLLKELLLEICDPIDDSLLFLDGFDPIRADVIRRLFKGQRIHHRRVLWSQVSIQWLTVRNQLVLG